MFKSHKMLEKPTFLMKSANINRILITLSDFLYWSFNRGDLGLDQSDNINRMITLTAITLSGFYCTLKTTAETATSSQQQQQQQQQQTSSGVLSATKLMKPSMALK